jgi:hypothetical protein
MVMLVTLIIPPIYPQQKNHESLIPLPHHLLIVANIDDEDLQLVTQWALPVELYHL